MTDRDFVLAIVKQDITAVKYAAAETLQHDAQLMQDRAFVLAAVAHGWALAFVSEELRRDPEVVLAAVSKNSWALQHASEELSADPAFMTQVLAANGYALQFASKELKG